MLEIMLFNLPEYNRKLRDISQKIWGKKSGDPTHPENRENGDWQAGYLLGCFTQNRDSGEDITPEWERRGKPSSQELYDDTVLERSRVISWRSWKAGYYAGRFSRL